MFIDGKLIIKSLMKSEFSKRIDFTNAFTITPMINDSPVKYYFGRVLGMQSIIKIGKSVLVPSRSKIKFRY